MYLIMIRKYFYMSLVCTLFFGCSTVGEDAQSIVDKSIKTHGGDLYENSIVEFDFRGRHYVVERNNGAFKYHRMFVDSLSSYHDILTNNGLQRLLNNKEVNLTEEWKRRYSNSINSVVYFALLPFGLNDESVNKNLIGDEEIKGKRYYKIKVTFNQEGGGEDFEDVFVYWINKNDYRMDYFAYYFVSDGGGIRFRESVNSREKSGLIFSDYINYKGPDGFNDVAGLAELFKSNELEKLSEIRLENLEVKQSNVLR